MQTIQYSAAGPCAPVDQHATRAIPRSQCRRSRCSARSSECSTRSRSLRRSLEAELEARRRQYAHYRDCAADLSRRRRASSGLRWASLATSSADGDSPRPTSSMRAVSAASTTARSTRTTASPRRPPSLTFAADLGAKLRFAQPGDVVIAAVGETVEDVAQGSRLARRRAGRDPRRHVRLPSAT